MRSEDVIALLEDYLTRYPAEEPKTRQVLEFVRTQPDFWSARSGSGHLTASAWIESPEGDRALLTHHRKLQRWLQLGGHMEDIDPTPLAAALREAREESGLETFDVVSPGLFDLDIHEIPARRDEPAHRHLDLRFRLRAQRSNFAAQEAESMGLRWVNPEELAALACDESVRRMARKWRA